MNIEIRELQPQTILSIRENCSPETKAIGDALGKIYDEIDEVIKENKLTIAAPCLTIFYDYSEKNVDIEGGTPINKDKDIKLSGRVKLNELPGGKTLVASYYGPYEGLSDAYMKFFDYIRDNNLQPQGPPWETYVINRQTEPDASKWLTEIHISLK
jgi:effector-binding domain-containing protein